ncbi:MAG: hypothetical protein ACREIU_00805 [Planctomycetota bacterium]
MRHLRSLNRKAARIAAFSGGDVHAQAQAYPFGCTTIFSPGWKTDSAGGTSGPCAPIDLVGRRSSRQQELKLEPRRWLTGVRIDGKRPYVGGAGERWDAHSTDTLVKPRTTEFPGDIPAGPIAVESGPM